MSCLIALQSPGFVLVAGCRIKGCVGVDKATASLGTSRERKKIYISELKLLPQYVTGVNRYSSHERKKNSRAS